MANNNEEEEKGAVQKQAEQVAEIAKKKLKKKIMVAVAPVIGNILLAVAVLCIIISVFMIISNFFTDIFSFKKEDENGELIDVNSVRIVKDDITGEYSFELDPDMIDNVYEQMNQNLKEQESGLSLSDFGMDKDLTEKMIKANMVTSLPKIGDDGFQGDILVNRYDAMVEDDKQEELVYISPDEFIQKYNDAVALSEELDLEGNSIYSYTGDNTTRTALENVIASLEEKDEENYDIPDDELGDEDDDFIEKAEAALEKKISTARGTKIEDELGKYSSNVVSGSYGDAAQTTNGYKPIEGSNLEAIKENTEDFEKDIEKKLKEFTKYYTIGKLSYDENGDLYVENTTIEDEENSKTIIECDLSNILMIKYNKTTQIVGSAREGEVTVTINGKQSTREYNDSYYAKNIEYEVDIETITYQNLVNQYSMPFEFLFSLLITSSSTEWVNEIADLVIEDSEIYLTIHDNYFENEERTIKRWTQIIDGKNTSGKIDRITTGDTTTGNHSLSVDIDKVKTWLYNKEILFEKEIVEDNEKVESTGPDDKGKKKNIREDQYTRDDEYEYIRSVEVNNPEDAQAISEETKNSNGEWIDYNPFLRLWKNSTGEVEIKTEKDENGEDVPINDKFEKNGIRVKYKILGGGKSCTDQAIIDGAQMLFMMLGNNQKTQNYETILRYLLYIYTGNEGYGETDVNDIIDIFNGRYFSSVSGIYGSSVQEKVWFSLKNLGYSDESIAGAMGNIHYESGGFSASAIEKDTGIGIGLCQWSYGRRTSLEQYAQSKGVSWTDEDTQIEFLITEITGQGAAVGYATYNFQTAHGYTKSSWDNATSIEDATKAFARTFERPSDSAYSTSINDRIDWAEHYYNEFHGKTIPNGGTTKAQSGDGYSQIYVSSTGKEFKEFKQYQGTYKNLIYQFCGETISSSGCSITSIAVVLSGYGVNVTPANLANHGRLREHFTSHGVSCTDYQSADANKIMNNLRSGKPMVVSIAGTLKAGGTSKYYAGHYIALLDARGTDEVYVSDVGSSKSTGWAKISDIINIVNRGILYTQ